jgi:hypothetical protein
LEEKKNRTFEIYQSEYNGEIINAIEKYKPYATCVKKKHLYLIQDRGVPDGNDPRHREEQ